MTSIDDELTDSSFEGSSVSTKDDPPTLDETIFDVGLYNLFLNYMKSQQAAGNLMFLKDARNYRMINQPREVLVHQAGKLIMSYFSPVAPFPVTISDEVKKQMIEYAFDPVAELQIDQNIFSAAFGEIYNAVVPHFRNWISTNEWREAIPFHRIPPPSFSVVLTSGTLRVLFNKYIKSQLERDAEDSASRAFHMWKFCIIANDFREGKLTHESHLDSKKKKKAKGESESSDTASVQSSKDGEGEGEKKMKPEEYAKRLYKKYKHHISLPYDGTISYSVFIVRALDQTIEEFDKSAFFNRWIDLKPYQGVDYQAKTVHQSLTPEGYAEPPTLAAALTSSILPLFMSVVQGSEQGLNLEFLTDILVFHQRFRKFDPSKSSTSSSSQDSSESSQVTRTDMIEEAKRIFSKYLEKGKMYCDPGLVDEIRGLITKGSGKGVNPTMFRKCGAFTYHRSEHTWCREARATFGWVGRSYDNRSKNARGVEEEFSMSLLPSGFDLQLVPSIDDVIDNPSLNESYYAYLNKQTDNLSDRFTLPFIQYFKTPVHERKPILNKIMGVFAEAAEKFPELAAPSSMISTEVAKRDRVTDCVVATLCASVVRGGARRFYKNWLIENSMVWKTAKWTPAAAVRYGDLFLLVGLNAVESEIEEEALKGKSGFSRYLAKRQLKKQAIHNLRTAPAAELKNSSMVLNTGNTPRGAGDSDSKASGAAITLVVPSIQDTLSSVYLRQLFTRMYLDTALSTTEVTLWEALCEFFKKYESLENEKLVDAQDEMRQEALDLCAKFKALIRNGSEVTERVKKQKILFPQLFRPLEEELYSKYHADYEAGLRKKGWN